MAGQILVIGAALVDFIGHYKSDGADIKNHAGTVRITVGGAAFNIATNIAIRKAADCCLFSYCPHGSISADIIRSICNSINLNNRWVSDDRISRSEPAYVALLRDKELDRGVTSSPIEHAAIFESGDLEASIKRSSIVVTETNLNADQIQIINRLAHRHKKPICCMIVSDAKASRLVDQDFSKEFELVTLNHAEAKAIGHDLAADEAAAHDSICGTLHSKIVIVTDGERGFVIFAKGKPPRRMPAVENITRVNELGAGDALFAAACMSVANGETMGSRESNNRISIWTAAVLSVEGANLVKERIEPIDQRDKSLSAGWLALLFGVATLAFSMTLGTTSSTAFWLGFFMSCLAGGLVGGIIRGIFTSVLGGGKSTDWKIVFLGTAIGFLAALLNSAPGMATGDLPFATAQRTASLNWVSVGAFIASFIASLAFEAILTQIGANPKSADPL